jgi:hypothetical protein
MQPDLRNMLAALQAVDFVQRKSIRLKGKIGVRAIAAHTNGSE